MPLASQKKVPTDLAALCRVRAPHHLLAVTTIRTVQAGAHKSFSGTQKHPGHRCFGQAGLSSVVFRARDDVVFRAAIATEGARARMKEVGDRAAIRLQTSLRAKFARDKRSELEADVKFRVDRALTICNTSAGRAAFLAGYAYYELGRYSASADLVAYPLSLGISFGLAVLAAGSSATISYYLSQLSPARQAYCEQTITPLVTLCSACFRCALLGNLASIALLGYRYYPTAYVAAVPCAFAACTGVIILAGWAYLHSTKHVARYVVAQLEDDASEGAPDEEQLKRAQGALLQAQNANALRALLILAFAQAGVARYQTAVATVGGVPACLNKLYLYLVTASTCLAFLAVASATDIVNFTSEFAPGRARDVVQQLTRSYSELSECIFEASLACMMLGVPFVGFGCSYICEDPCELNDEWTPQPTCANARTGARISPLATSGDCYQTFAYWPMVAGVLGCLLIFGGALYARVCEANARAAAVRSEYSSFFDGITVRIGKMEEALETIASFMANADTVAMANADTMADGQPPLPTRKKPLRMQMQQKTLADLKAASSTSVDLRERLPAATLANVSLSTELEEVEATVQRCSTYAGQTTVIASTVFYNIVTFETDVLNPFVGWGLPANGVGKGATLWTGMFLVAALLAFVCGLGCLFLSESFRKGLASLEASQAKLHFASSMTQAKLHFASSMAPITAMVHALFNLSMLGVYTLLATIGMAKYDGDPSTLVLVGAVLACTIVGSVSLTRECSKCMLMSKKTMAVASGALAFSLSSAREHTRLSEQLGIFAPNAIFFGSFAYNACVFLYTWHEPYVSAMYLFFMMTSFLCSLAALTWQTTWHACLMRLGKDERRKEVFARSTAARIVSRTAFLAYVLSGYLFLCGFFLFGWIKNEGSVCGGKCPPSSSGFSRYTYIMAAAACVGLILIFHSARVAVSESFVEGIKSDLCSSPFEPSPDCVDGIGWQGSIDTVRSIAAQTTFVVGNVFYQILFSQVQKEPSLTFVNWLYFSSASASLIVGIAAIVLANRIAVYAADLETDARKAAFARHCAGLMTVVFQLYLVCIFLWIGSFSLLGVVNYAPVFWTTFAPGAGLSAALLAVWLCTRNAHRKSGEFGLPQSEASRLQHAPRRSPLAQFEGGVHGVLLPPNLLFFVWFYSVRHVDGVKSVSRDFPITWPAFEARVKAAILGGNVMQEFLISESDAPSGRRTNLTDQLTTDYVRFESTGAPPPASSA